MKRWMLSLTLAAGLLFLITGQAWAGAVPAPVAAASTPSAPLADQSDNVVPFGEWVSNFLQRSALSLGVGSVYVISTVEWFLTRFALFVIQTVLGNDWSTQLVDTTLQQLQTTMPQTLQSIMLGQNGLLYIALAIAGLTMVFPFLMRGSPVRIDRVFIWAALILGLFAGSEAAGYNVISLFEHTRVAMLQAILGMGGQNPAGALQHLVLEPWRATQAEAQLDLNFRVPQGFKQAFFPEPEFERRKVEVIFNFWEADWALETPQSMERRRSGAFQAMFWSSVGMYGVIVLGFVAVAFIALTLASLLLIVLFLATLPLALFSFGEALVLRVVHRWLGVVAMTIFLGVFLKITSGWVQNLSLAGSELSAVVTWFIWMTLMLITFAKFSHLSLDLFTGSLLLVGSITSAVTGAAQFQEVRGSTQTVQRGLARATLMGVGLMTGIAESPMGSVLSRPGVAAGIVGSVALAGGLPTVAPFGAVAGELLYTGGRWTGRQAYRAGRWAVRKTYHAFRGRENVFMARTGA
ncbi:MAG: hypothetical protein GXO55_05670 [Chloroflexi bacterium]|nr:hypothetical protein [Chloroflexota bacterium]